MIENYFVKTSKTEEANQRARRLHAVNARLEIGKASVRTADTEKLAKLMLSLSILRCFWQILPMLFSVSHLIY
ncbi:TPA: hypothetical protein ACW7MP_000341 [Enterobacter hormaechei]